jgi:hypothetical protein
LKPAGIRVADDCCRQIVINSRGDGRYGRAKITIDHGRIQNLDMDAMTMVFRRSIRQSARACRRVTNSAPGGLRERPVSVI